MAIGSVHTVYRKTNTYRQGFWVNEIEGGAELPNRYATQEGAIAGGRVEATNRRADHVIHDTDGTVRSVTPWSSAAAKQPNDR